MIRFCGFFPQNSSPTYSIVYSEISVNGVCFGHINMATLERWVLCLSKAVIGTWATDHSALLADYMYGTLQSNTGMNQYSKHITV